MISTERSRQQECEAERVRALTPRRTSCARATGGRV